MFSSMMGETRVTIERAEERHDDAVRAAVLHLVLRGLPEPLRSAMVDGTLAQARDDAETTAELWGAFAAGSAAPIGAAWGQLRPGGTAVVWPPQWTVPRETPPADPLLAALVDALKARGTILAQSLLPNRTVPEAAVLTAGGFERLADLQYLAAAANTAGDRRTDVAFVPLNGPARQSRLADVVRRTYAGTLDCPQLNGVRTAEEALDEYRTVGASGDRLWRIVCRDGIDVGCLLMADYPPQDQLELVYMGIVPEARGRRLGDATVGEALRMAQELGRARVVLAVDAANFPALAMYGRCRFVPWETRSVYVHRFAVR